MWRILALVSFVVALTITGIWLAHGSQTLTKDKIKVVVRTKSPDFGTEEEHIEWRDGFRLGLDLAAPTAGIALVVGVVSLLKMRRSSSVS
jgi:hypothetical protein